MSKRYEQFSFVISTIHRSMQKIERSVMVQYGYRGAYAQFLVVLHHFPEGLSSKRLCELCEKDKAAVSRMIMDLEREGLVARKSVGREGSRYRALIHLTEEGSRIADAVCEKAREVVEAGGKGLSAEERKTFYSAMDVITKNLSGIINGTEPRRKPRTRKTETEQEA